MICPYCKMNIEGNLYFCDQCGQEMLTCPDCGNLGKGKKCIHDGTTLITRRERAGFPDVSPAEKVGSGGAGPPLTEARTACSHAAELHLINRRLDLDLAITGDQMIGREVGTFTETFSGYPQVSRQHCEIRFDKKNGWSVVDLDSTNGTRLNNVPLIPRQAQPLTDRSLLLIANIEFYIEMRDDGVKNGTMRL